MCVICLRYTVISVLSSKGKNPVWPNVLHHTYFQCTEWKAKIIPTNFVLKFRTVLPWLQSDRCQNGAEYLINAEINTQNMLFGMTTLCVYIRMPLFIVLQMVAHSDVHPQICLILIFPILGNYHFSLFTLTTTKMASRSLSFSKGEGSHCNKQTQNPHEISSL